MSFATIRLETNRLILTTPCSDDGDAMLGYYLRNRRNFEPWMPAREERFYTLAQMHARIASMQEKMLEKNSQHLLLRLAGCSTIIGECGFTNIIRGPFQACYLGFSICHEFEGKGLMHEALEGATAFVFNALNLHRIMANYLPENHRSHRLLDRLGFEKKGCARAYLNINGHWRDHMLTSLINCRCTDQRTQPSSTMNR